MSQSSTCSKLRVLFPGMDRCSIPAIKTVSLDVLYDRVLNDIFYAFVPPYSVPNFRAGNFVAEPLCRQVNLVFVLVDDVGLVNELLWV